MYFCHILDPLYLPPMAICMAIVNLGLVCFVTRERASKAMFWELPARVRFQPANAHWSQSIWRDFSTFWAETRRRRRNKHGCDIFVFYLSIHNCCIGDKLTISILAL
jgi:hypothetical protein